MYVCGYLMISQFYRLIYVKITKVITLWDKPVHETIRGSQVNSKDKTNMCYMQDITHICFIHRVITLLWIGNISVSDNTSCRKISRRLDSAGSLGWTVSLIALKLHRCLSRSFTETRFALQRYSRYKSRVSDICVILRWAVLCDIEMPIDFTFFYKIFCQLWTFRKLFCDELDPND